MRTSGDITVRTTASMRALLLTAVLTGTALVGTAAYAHAGESAGTDRSRAQDEIVGQDLHAAPPVLTGLARPRFTEPLGTP